MFVHLRFSFFLVGLALLEFVAEFLKKSKNAEFVWLLIRLYDGIDKTVLNKQVSTINKNFRNPESILKQNCKWSPKPNPNLYLNLS